MHNIRIYQTADYAAVRENLEKSGLLDADIDTEKRLEAKINKDPESILVATKDDKVIGNVFLIEDGWTAFIFRLAVLEAERGKGIGRDLMRAAEEVLRKRSINQVAIFVDTKNDKLQHFYTEDGYSIGPSGPYRFMYKSLSKS